MHIAAFEAFYTGSHKAWLDGLKNHSKHKIDLYTLKGKYWKWRMHAGAISLIKQIQQTQTAPDLILTTDMTDVALLKSLLPYSWSSCPIILYFHENQLSYPWNENDSDLQFQRERHYAFINYTSALVADACLFNSHYHYASFIDGLTPFLKAYPDQRNLETVKEIKNKSSVLHLGLDLKQLEIFRTKHTLNKKPVFLWNHRWESDKNYLGFIKLMSKLNDDGFDFELIIAGKSFNEAKEHFTALRKQLGSKIIHFGYASEYKEYAQLLWKADFIPVTSIQDFFGISIAEAIYCNCIAILPNRLSYPDLFKKCALFYQTDNELLTLIKRLIQTWPSKTTLESPHKINKFDWSQLISKYDKLFASFLK